MHFKSSDSCHLVTFGFYNQTPEVGKVGMVLASFSSGEEFMAEGIVVVLSISCSNQVEIVNRQSAALLAVLISPGGKGHC